MKQIRIFDLKFNQKEIKFFLKNSKKIFEEGFLVIIPTLENLKINLKK